MLSFPISSSRSMAAAAATAAVANLRRSSALRAVSTAKTPLSFLNGRPRISASVFPLAQRHRSVRQISAISDEEAAAKVAATSADSGGPTIFDKIIAKEIPSTIVYEDEKVLAFRDINPQAPVHVLIIPKIRDGLTQLSKAEPRHGEILGHLLYAAKIVAEKEGIRDGFRVVINDGPDGCQSVYHLHLHILGGRQMKWPPG